VSGLRANLASRIAVALPSRVGLRQLRTLICPNADKSDYSLGLRKNPTDLQKSEGPTKIRQTRLASPSPCVREKPGKAEHGRRGSILKYRRY
jgi:hypothetical protein